MNCIPTPPLPASGECLRDPVGDRLLFLADKRWSLTHHSNHDLIFPVRFSRLRKMDRWQSRVRAWGGHEVNLRNSRHSALRFGREYWIEGDSLHMKKWDEAESANRRAEVARLLLPGAGFSRPRKPRAPGLRAGNECAVFPM